ncbi:MAG TPA: class I SAM-dependent methyltransferase [Candidatus Nanoarchaeia archaeon]|nr:class I SAM-dependent methyltransferase [Candidatus Nanoarchaeia archaeon]
MTDRWDKEYSGTAHWEKEPSSHSKKFITFLNSGEKVFDAGCGSGRDSFFLAEQGFDVWGVDISKVGIEKAKTKAQKRGLNIHFSVSGLEHLSFNDDFFDGIYSGYTMQDTNFKKSVKELARVLKRGKVLCLTMFEETEYEKPCKYDQKLNHDKILNNFKKFFEVEEEKVDEYTEKDQYGKHRHKRLVLVLRKR